MHSSTSTAAASSIRTPERRFRPTAGATIASLVAFVILLALGTWQLYRLQWKEGLIATANARMAAPPAQLPARAGWQGWDFRHVTLRGAYRNGHSVAFGLSTSSDGEVGAHLLTPLVLDDGRAVLVDRGWLPERDLPPAVPRSLEPEGPRTLDGILRWRGDSGPRLFTPADDLSKPRIYSFDWPELRHLTGLPLLPIVVRLERSDGPGGLPAPDATVVDYRNAHLGYAITWYGLAASLVVIYVAFSRRDRSE